MASFGYYGQVAGKRALIAGGITAVCLILILMTASSLVWNVRVALWGFTAFFATLLLLRVLGGDQAWLTARSRLFDSVFLVAIIVGLALTIGSATTPSPI